MTPETPREKYLEILHHLERGRNVVVYTDPSFADQLKEFAMETNPSGDHFHLDLNGELETLIETATEASVMKEMPWGLSPNDAGGFNGEFRQYKFSIWGLPEFINELDNNDPEKREQNIQKINILNLATKYGGTHSFVVRDSLNDLPLQIPEWAAWGVIHENISNPYRLEEIRA
ncbi:hypothetical protein GF389_02525 [Candidatus Dojkabacteria bacterium]|nr:hypothetical protein [Candidatus Dojkabacteria bacterium]